MSETATFFLPLSQSIMQDLGMALALMIFGLGAVFAWVLARHARGRSWIFSRVFAPVCWARRRWINARVTKAIAQLNIEHLNPSDVNRSYSPDLGARRDALLSLERIAQNAVRFDEGGYHVRVMEVLCAYIQENSPASNAVNFPLPEWTPLHEDATENEKAQHVAWRDVRFANRINSNAREWAASLKPLRSDIVLALSIIGRRSDAQRAVEANWVAEADQTERWVFDTPCPVLNTRAKNAPRSVETVEAYKSNLRKWRCTLTAFRGYRPDLRETNLQAADLSHLVLSGVRLDRARLDGANLSEARLEGSALRDAQLRGAVLYRANLNGADLRRACLEGAVLREATLHGAILRKARAEWANFKEARMDGADLFEARLEVASFFKAQMAGVILYHSHMDGAVLKQAKLEAADLRRARLAWATLRDAQLDGANLGWAQLDGADLGGAQMPNAELYKAKLRGADLRQAQMARVSLCRADLKDATSLATANLKGALLKEIDLTALPLTQAQVDQTFGDTSVILPDGITPPPHWPNWDVPIFEPNGSLNQWRTWCMNPDGYTPSQAPNCQAGFEVPFAVSLAK